MVVIGVVDGYSYAPVAVNIKTGVQLWSTSSLDCNENYYPQCASVVAFTPDSKTFFANWNFLTLVTPNPVNPAFAAYDTNTGTQLWQYQGVGAFAAMAVTPDSTMVLVSDTDASLLDILCPI